MPLVVFHRPVRTLEKMEEKASAPNNSLPHFEPIPIEVLRLKHPTSDISHNLNTINTLTRLRREPIAARAFTWGYTIIRTEYSPKSDLEFPRAIKKLSRWMVYLVLEDDSQGPELRAPVYELAARLYNEVLQDARLDGASWPAVHAFFVEWVQAQGANHPRKTIHTNPSYPRFNSPIVVDADTLASLRALPDLPPGFDAATLEVLRALPELPSGFAARLTKDDIAYAYAICSKVSVWVYDILGPTGREEYGDDYDLMLSPYRGWMKVEVSSLQHYWFMRVSRVWRAMPCREDPDKSGVLRFGC